MCKKVEGRQHFDKKILKCLRLGTCFGKMKMELPHSQAVRHRTLTPTFRSFESNWGSHND